MFRALARRRPSSLQLLCWAAVVALSLVPEIVSAQCLKDARETKFAAEGGSTKVVTYLCKTAPQASAASVRVEFHRLSEAASFGVLSGKPWPEVEKVLGKARVLDNPVKREALSLFDQFGISEEREDAFHFQAFPAAGGKASEKVSSAFGRKTFTYLTYPDTEGFTEQSLALPEDQDFIRKEQGWPKDYKFYYSSFPDQECKPDNFSCYTLWRYFRADDIAKFVERYKIQQAEMEAQQRAQGFEPTPEDSSTPIPGTGPLKLIEHLTKDGWPEDFIVVVGQYSGCGGGYDFGYYPRQLIIDVAILQNVSSQPISVGELLGSQVETSGLRPPAPPMRGVVAAGIVPIPGAVGKLAPGERVLVPLKLTFVSPKGLASRFSGKLADARKIYAEIEKLPPGTLIKENVGGDPSDPGTGTLGKFRESFPAPELPKVTPYSWGPEISLKGAMIDGQRVILDETSANFLELTAGEGYGSCPFLYAYDEEARTWVNHGKVIDKADTADKEFTQEKPMSRFATRFRLREEELEMALINRVALDVTLKNGSTIVLLPEDPRLKSKDSDYVRILAGRYADVSFALPLGTAEADVASSKLSITGYYRRYSAMKFVTNEVSGAE